MEPLGRIESSLIDYHKLLSEVWTILQANKSKGLLRRTIDRKSDLSDVEKYDRLVDNYNTDFLTDFLLQSHIAGLLQGSAPSVMTSDPPFVYKSVLPQQPELMIGRDEEKSRVIDTLLNKSPARIAILGAGGMGKTTLALSVLHDPAIVDRYPSRYFVSCEGTPTKLSVIVEIADALRIPRESRDARLLDSILSVFPKDSLLCLDNLETIWDEEAARVDLEELLSDLQLPNLSLMITMRGTQRPSRVSWSKPFLPPLQVLSQNTSRRIFEITCGRSPDEFEEELLVAVDGIPLAISLVCSMLEEGNENSESLWNRWGEAQSKVLGNGGKDRLSNLETSIRLSVEGPRMQADSRTIEILAMLSFLPDGFPDNEVAKKELQGHLPMGYDLSEALLTLRRVSLVHLDEAGASRRLRMLNPVRNFCQKRIHFTMELKSSITSFYVAMLHRFEDYTLPEGHAIIPSELHNARAVLKLAWKEGRGNPTIARASIRFTNWSKYLGDAVEEVICLAIEGVAGELDVCGSCHQALGWLYLQSWRLDLAEESFQRALELHGQVHNTLGKAKDTWRLGQVHLRRNSLDKAEAFFEQALPLFRQVHNIVGEANSSRALAEVHLGRNKLNEAENLLEHAFRLHQQVSDSIGAALDLQTFGEVYVRQNKLDRAELSFDCALQLFRQLQSPYGQAYNLQNLGGVRLQQNKLDEAEGMFERSLQLYRQIKNLRGEAYSLTKLGEVCLRRNKKDEAAELFERALQLRRQT
ncbi:hypothetical protein H0H87_009605 [Tephrocybe sp. NHM501043]|nr:hypothetical protein H0H87_009605 [Tephrocybe sp. NHM501043]